MQDRKFFSAVLVLLMVLAAAPVLGADVAKIGIVTFQEILEKSDAGKAAQAQIKKAGKDMEDALKAKGQEIEELQKKMEREALVMSKEMREQKEREGRIMVGDFKSMQQKYKEEFQRIEGQLVKQIQSDVFRIVGDIGKKEGYLLILEKVEAGVVYAPTAIDITDKVVKQYNSEYAQKKTAAGKKIE
jgi:outer membrane protein